jgi:hypothetical protein
MPLTILFMIAVGIVREAVRGVRRLPARRPRGMCVGCRFVHMQYGATGRNAVFCTFGGVVRLVQIDVLYCTDYLDRNTSARLVRIGFAPEVNGVEVHGDAQASQAMMEGG